MYHLFIYLLFSPYYLPFSFDLQVEKELLSIQNTLNKMEADHIDLESLESIAERLEKTAQSVEISKDEEVEYISRCQSRLSIYDNALSQHRSVTIYFFFLRINIPSQYLFS